MPASPRALSPGSGIVMPYVAVRHPEKCHRYGICSEIVDRPGTDDGICIGCRACVLTCPHQALEPVEEPRQGEVYIEVKGNLVRVPEKISIKEVFKRLGYMVATSPQESGLFVPFPFSPLAGRLAKTCPRIPPVPQTFFPDDLNSSSSQYTAQ